MLYLPLVVEWPVRIAWPAAFRVTLATMLPFTTKATVPVGVLVPDGWLTVTVNVTFCPTLIGLEEATRVVVVGAGAVDALTFSVRVCVLPSKFVSPLYTAVMVWVPVVEKLVDRVALPPASTVAVPITAFPSLKVTVPVGVPAPGATGATTAVKV